MAPDLVVRFRDLAIGTSFDFVDDANPGTTSFWLRVTKGGTRRYTDEAGVQYRVGSINARVFHVGPPQADR
jgi:hypothetical protein